MSTGVPPLRRKLIRSRAKSEGFLLLIFGIAGLLAFLPQSEAQTTIFNPLSARIYPSLLASSARMGRQGLSFYGQYAGMKDGGSGYALTGAFPFNRKPEDIRPSGWSFGFGAGVTELGYQEKKYLAPGSYFFELMLGRAVNDFVPGSDIGLRGYMEVALRDQRPRRSNFLQTLLDASLQSLPEHQYSLALRIGASSDPDGKGLVAQASPGSYFGLYSGIYFPLSDQRTLLTVEGEYLGRWLTPFLWGLSAKFFSSTNNLFKTAKDTSDSAQSIHLRRYASVGPAVRFKFGDRQSFGLDFQWQFFSAMDLNANGLPALETYLNLTF